MINRIKSGIGNMIRPMQRSNRLGQAGQGGTARFAGIAEEWANPYRRPGILHGQSLHDPSWRVGLQPDKHLITQASSGSGKDRSRVQPTLLDFPGSVIVGDVGGSNAAVTGYARGDGGGRVRNGMGQDVYVLNPHDVHAGHPSMPPSCRFEPLSTVDLNSPSVVEQILAIAEGLIANSDRGEPHWPDSARALVAALIGYTLTAPLDENEGVKARTLVEVRRLLTLPDGPPVTRMIASTALRGMVAKKAMQLKIAEEKEKSGILSTAIQQTDWIDSHAMEKMLSGSDFDLLDLKRRPSTLYLVLPPEYLHAHSRFLRLFFSLALSAATRVGSGGVPLLFIMPEFYSLGRLDSMAAAAANIRKHKVILWPFIQNLGQLRELYRDNWETFIGNSHLEVFGVNDLTSARYASDMLGHVVVERKDRDGVKRPAAVAPLRDPAELAFEVAPDSDRMIVYRGGPPPYLLKRLNYDRIYSKSQYNADPDIQGS